MQRAGHEDKIKGVPGFESWGFRDNQHDKWNVCRLGSMYAGMDVDMNTTWNRCPSNSDLNRSDSDVYRLQLSRTELRINKVIYFHKFLPSQMECFWPKFLKYRDNCADPKYEYKDVPPLCDPSMWYLEKMTDPILSGTNYHRFVTETIRYWIKHQY